ncbi:MAG TPA: penicillin-insensitive murein endopeptidase [Acetobacteraceae bacterium]|nr:penicillin-insensitive murein endopeptidase [Acetobacteraceae bacterium]
MRYPVLLFALLLSAPAVAAPAPGPLRIIGTNGAACIAGAVELPPHGPGYQQIRADKSSFWGAPSTIAAIEQLGAEVHAAGLPDLYIGDIALPRGGPFAPHFSHQRGLDVDIYYDLLPKPRLPLAARDNLDPPWLTNRAMTGVNPKLWSRDEIRLIGWAAHLPHVNRIFVNPAIKRAMCEAVHPHPAWFHLVQAWWGHTAHMHIRFSCPADQPACINQPPPPPGLDCGRFLAWWFPNGHPRPLPRGGVPFHPVLPAACHAILKP